MLLKVMQDYMKKEKLWRQKYCWMPIVMEKFGAVGVARLFLRCALDGDTIKESIIKHRRMFNIIKDYVETGTAKKMFMERYMFTQNFLERFEKESKAEL